jgi:hypothetical protein
VRKHWFTLLMASICLEGLGRKYVPEIPTLVLYFVKDLVLLIGFVLFRPTLALRSTIGRLYAGFGVVLVAAIFWTVVQMANANQTSWPLALIGLRAYWFWWIAPPIIASALREQTQKNRAIYVLAILTIGIAILAAAQFASPADSSLNLYSVVDGEAQYASGSGTVYATGRARVSATFAFISGFSDYTILVPALLLSLGLDARSRRIRILALTATLFSAAVLPMSGSRSSVILGVSVLVLTVWGAGLFFTVVGRRIIVGAMAGLILATVAFPDAILGVESRFEPEETQSRVLLNLMVLPPVALLMLDYPSMGIGTGMQQNARAALHVPADWETEIETQRYLVELGIPGYLLVWTAKFGLVVGLLKAYRILKRAGRPGAASAALSYAVVTYFGYLTFDHIWEALYFVGCGFILAETTSVLHPPAIKEKLAPETPSLPSRADILTVT